MREREREQDENGDDELISTHGTFNQSNNQSMSPPVTSSFTNSVCVCHDVSFCATERSNWGIGGWWRNSVKCDKLIESIKTVCLGHYWLFTVHCWALYGSPILFPPKEKWFESIRKQSWQMIFLSKTLVWLGEMRV